MANNKARSQEFAEGRTPNLRELELAEIEKAEASMWPTPDCTMRPHEGNVRLLRKKVMAGEMSEHEANAILGKSVWDSQGKVPEVPPEERRFWGTPLATLGEKDFTITPGMAQRVHDGKGANLVNQVAAEIYPETHPDFVHGMDKPEEDDPVHTMDKEELWPTPNASNAGNDVNLRCSGDGRTRPNKLGWAVAEKENLWPTPHANCHTGPGRQGRQGGANLQTAVSENPERLWPTPTASLANGAAATWKEGEVWWKQSRAARNLEAMAQHPERLWPTPTLKTTSNTDDPDDLVNKDGEPWQLGEKPYDRRTGRPVTTALADAVRSEPGEFWPTPRTEGFDAGPHRGKLDSLPAAVKAGLPVNPKDRPKLCAAWVTRLMGYPDGWLDLDSNHGAETGNAA